MPTQFVIPGRERQRANPESIIPSAAVYGFRVRRSAPSRNDSVYDTKDAP